MVFCKGMTQAKKQASRIFKVTFVNQGKVYEIYAEDVTQGSLFGFVEVRSLLFGERSKVAEFYRLRPRCSGKREKEEQRTGEAPESCPRFTRPSRGSRRPIVRRPRLPAASAHSVPPTSPAGPVSRARASRGLVLDEKWWGKAENVRRGGYF